MTPIYVDYSDTAIRDQQSPVVRSWRIKLHNRRILIGVMEDGRFAVTFLRLTAPREIQTLQFSLSAEAFHAFIDGGLQILTELEQEQ